MLLFFIICAIHDSPLTAANGLSSLVLYLVDLAVFFNLGQFKKLLYITYYNISKFTIVDVWCFDMC